MTQHIKLRNVIVIFLIITYACKTTAPCDNGNPRNGIYIDYYDSKKEYKRHQYETLDCAGHGPFVNYYPNGVIESQGKMNNGKTIGSIEYFDAFGNKQGEMDLKQEEINLQINDSLRYVYHYKDYTIEKLINEKRVNILKLDNDLTFFKDNHFSYKLLDIGNGLIALNSDLTLSIIDSNLSMVNVIERKLSLHDKIWGVQFKTKNIIEYKIWLDKINQNKVKTYSLNIEP